MDLEGSPQEFLRVLNVRPSAEVDIIVTGVVHRDLLIGGKVVDELGLVLLILKDDKRLVPGDFLSCPGLSALDDLVHAVLDGLEVALCDGLALGQDEIIVCTVLNLGSDCILHIFAIELDDGLCQDVCQRVAVQLQIFFVFHWVLLPGLSPGDCRDRRCPFQFLAPCPQGSDDADCTVPGSKKPCRRVQRTSGRDVSSVTRFHPAYPAHRAGPLDWMITESPGRIGAARRWSSGDLSQGHSQQTVPVSVAADRLTLLVNAL